MRLGPDGLVRLDREREHVGVGIQFQGGSQQGQHAPLAARGGEAESAVRIVGFVEPKRLATLGVPIAPLSGQLFDVLGCHEEVGVVQIQLANARCVGDDGDVIVGHALRGPDGADLVLARPDDLQHPDFLRVGDGERFADVTPTVSFQQLACQSNRLPRRRGSFQNQACERLAVDQPFVAQQLITSAESRFADGQLLLVHTGVGWCDVAKGLLDLGDLAGGDTAVAWHGAAVVIAALAQRTFGPAAIRRCWNQQYV